MAQHRRMGDAFVASYTAFLERGGSASPAELLGDLGLKLDEPAVWDDGFAELERMIDEARGAV
jgi:oligoendopeptidase F